MNIKLDRMSWYTDTCEIMSMALLYKLALWSKVYMFMFGLGSNGCFVIGGPYLNGGHDYGRY
jgi:hypothetical protein